MPSAPFPTFTAVAPFAWPITVYLEDTDATGVAYHAGYLRWFERARSEWLKARGQSHATLLSDHAAAFTLSEVAVQYRTPARLGDELQATVTVAARSRITLGLSQRLHRREAPHALLAEAQVTVVCVGAESFKPRAWPAGWLEGLVAG